MNENDLSDLSYKELQALAHTYRVPGNIKKHLLVRTLQAIQSGNELEVDRMLTEVQQTRKKRVKKQKLNIMNVITSTPIRSPNYTIPDDCYYTRHQPPYQWVGAEEEIAIRDEEASRVPNYTEFQQFLLRRIQRDQYEAYGRTSDNEIAQGPSIVDLRMGAGSSVLRPIIADANRPRSSVTFDPNNYARPSSDVELQILEERAADNNQASGKPELLKKLLEAPVGANLGKIASPDTGSQRFWPLDQYPSNNGNNTMDDSDTLTADSENDNEDAWDNNNNSGNVNNPMSYYYPMNDARNETYEPDMPSRNPEVIGQSRNNASNEGTQQQQYPFGYDASDIQSNCEKWIAANNFVNRDAGYAEQFIEHSRACNNVYYGDNCANSTLTRSMNRDRKYQYCNETNETIHYEANTIIHEQRYNLANEAHSYYQSNNALVESAIDPNEIYYNQQQITRQPIADENREYFAHGTNDLQSLNPSQFLGNICDKDPPVSYHHHNHHHHHHQNNNNNNNNNFNNNNNNNINDMQYDSGYYQYSQENALAAGFTGTINANEQQEQCGVIGQTANERRNLVESSTACHPISDGVLDPYWPRWPINPAETCNGSLETILNLHNRGSAGLDRSRSNETSSVYCYTGPIVTQRIESGHATWCTQNKPPIAEARQHIFTPNVLLYNDASTGMIMANPSDPSSSDPSSIDRMILEASKDETVNSSVDRDYELRVSDNSSDSTINDVWIHDYENYPVSSDNPLQSVDLTNDENDDDLFTTVRDTSRNSIDDHTIETFTDIHY